ncbi:MAG: N-acetyltransferase [Chitinophagaceae bacterium]|nr:MAG: N-acetyltransferase [Chitinophagaceae bacterium]
MKIEIDTNLYLELISEVHAPQIFNVVEKNRAHLRPWLPFVDTMQNVQFAENFVNGTIRRNKEGTEYAFVIIAGDEVVGRIGLYKIDNLNRVGELGYWLAESHQGKGIVTRACRTLINFCFSDVGLNRIEIRCGTQNTRSKAIPEKLNFRFEGVIRQGELLYEKFIDLNLYSLLREELKL